MCMHITESIYTTMHAQIIGRACYTIMYCIYNAVMYYVFTLNHTNLISEYGNLYGGCNILTNQIAT